MISFGGREWRLPLRPGENRDTVTSSIRPSEPEAAIRTLCQHEDFHGEISLIFSDGTLTLPVREIIKYTQHFDAWLSLGHDWTNPLAFPIFGYRLEPFRMALFHQGPIEDVNLESEVLFIREVFQIRSNPGEADEQSEPAGDCSVCEGLVCESADDSSGTVDPAVQDDPIFSRNKRTVMWKGFEYQRRSKDRYGRYYYYCKKKCGASILINENGQPLEIKPHSCCESPSSEVGIVAIGQPEWEIFIRELEERIISNPVITPVAVLQQMYDENEQWRELINATPYDSLMNVCNDILQTPPIVDQISDCPFDAFPAEDGFVKLHIVGSTPLVIMASDYMLNRATHIAWILIDGTFKSSPRQFQQLLNILGEDVSTGQFIPIAHILLADKQEESYKAAFDMLSAIVSFPALQLVTCDFEEGLRNSVRYWLGQRGVEDHVILMGCRFHFTQCLVRKMIEIYGKRKLSGPRREVMTLFCMFPYFSRDEIERILAEFDRRNHDCEKFIQYFRNFWMRNFSSWNLTDQGEYVRARSTNNAMESFNRQVNDLFVRNCPRIEKLIEGLKKLHEEKQVHIETEPCREELAANLPVREELEHRFRELWNHYPLKE